MPSIPPVLLADLTTLRVGGPVDRVLEATDAAALVAAVRSVDEAAEPLLVVAGGSNLLAGDDGWRGTAVLVRTDGIQVHRDGPDVLVRVAAGVGWESLVEHAVAQGWAGIECLAGIPGSVGATPVQNVGAYGQEVATTVTAVTVWDRVTARIDVLSTQDCRFAYRSSRFKHSDRWVILDVAFRLAVTPVGGPIRYGELARLLGVAPGGHAPLAAVAEAVLSLRRGKGMVLDAADHDTWSAGSFFTNPIVDAATLATVQSRAAGLPTYPEADGRTKLPAAWLIEHAGVQRGHGVGPARVSGKHTLALTNRGGARAADVLELAREVRDRVEAAYGIVLAPEPRLVGCTL